jgi:hypothetical protein
MPNPKPTFWHRVSSLAWHSLTVAWGYALIVAGAALDVLPLVADFFNAPEAQAVVTTYAGPYASHVLKLGGLITVLVRLRTLHSKT